MAGIDKTYVDKEQYLQARKFWCKTYKKQIKDLGQPFWLYPFTAIRYGDWDETLKTCPTLVDNITPKVLETNTLDIDYCGDDSPLWNTSTVQDIWLFKNCKLDFVQERLKQQYTDDNYFDKFKDIDFKQKPWLCSFKLKSSETTVHLWDEMKEGDTEITYYDKMLIYGTSFGIKVLGEVYKLITERYSKPELIDEINLEWYNLEFIYKNNIWTLNNEEINLPFREFEMPKINYSFNLKDLQKYDLSEVFISTDDDIYELSSFKYVKHKEIKYLPHYNVPEYIWNLIKK